MSTTSGQIVCFGSRDSPARTYRSDVRSSSRSSCPIPSEIFHVYKYPPITLHRVASRRHYLASAWQNACCLLLPTCMFRVTRFECQYIVYTECSPRRRPFFFLNANHLRRVRRAASKRHYFLRRVMALNVLLLLWNVGPPSTACQTVCFGSRDSPASAGDMMCGALLETFSRHISRAEAVMLLNANQIPGKSPPSRVKTQLFCLGMALHVRAASFQARNPAANNPAVVIRRTATPSRLSLGGGSIVTVRVKILPHSRSSSENTRANKRDAPKATRGLS